MSQGSESRQTLTAGNRPIYETAKHSLQDEQPSSDRTSHHMTDEVHSSKNIVRA